MSTKFIQNIKCYFGYHDWAKCIHPSNGMYLYGQKFCTNCFHRACGYAKKEVAKEESVVANGLVFNWE